MCIMDIHNYVILFPRVAVLRPVPAGVSVGATRTLELGGAKRGGGGGGKRREAVVQHSVLGSLEEYTAQVADHGLVSRVSEGGGGERGGKFAY